MAKIGAIWGVAAAAALALAFGPAGVHWLQRSQSTQRAVVAFEAPAVSRPWEGPIQATEESWRPGFAGAAYTRLVRYTRDGGAVYLYVAYYRDQAHGAELVNSQNTIYDRERWQRTGERRHSISLPDSRRMRVAEIDLRSPQTQRLVWYWYRVSDHTTPYAVIAKLYEVWSRLQGNYKGAAIVAIASDYTTDADQARRTVQDFMMHLSSATALGDM